MKKRYLFLLILPFLVFSQEIPPPVVDPIAIWQEKITDELFNTVKGINHGREYPVMVKRGFSEELLRDQVSAAWEASQYNPKWGNRKEVTRKLLGVNYHESRFNPSEVQINKRKLYTVDVGNYQINSCNWYGADRKNWVKACKVLEMNPADYSLLFNPRVNAIFAAMLNEQFIKIKKPYRYHRVIYRHLSRIR